ncbi:MAG: sulfite exporter TauE/SafE family protein, partial [Clostridia bacterium]|nr:sulfite exporter TauE/SafE family protein [Clostridia bacterium]
LFFLLSFVAGGINGFLGTGGGIIFIFMLSFLTNNESKNNYATSLCATFIISSVGVFTYLKNSNVDFSMIGQVFIPAISGGVFGALVVDRINVKYLNMIFALLIIYSGINLIIR